MTPEAGRDPGSSANSAYPPAADRSYIHAAMNDRKHEITRLLQEMDSGPEQDAAALLPLVYEELRALARAKLAHEPPGQTLQATGLVHEAFLRLVGSTDPGWKGRGHFFGAAALAMRRILVEQARRKAATPSRRAVAKGRTGGRAAVGSPPT